MRPALALGMLVIPACASSPAGTMVPAGPPYSYDDAEQFVAAASACVPALAATDFFVFGEAEVDVALSRSIDFRWSIDQVRCVVAAGSDCTAVRACLDLTIDTTMHCTMSTSSCMGDLAVGCHPAETTTTPSYGWTVDCGRRAMTCYQSAPGVEPMCVPRPCTMVNRTTCQGDSLAHQCDSATTLAPCADGLVCMVYDHNAQCLGAPCSGHACDGDTAVICAGSGHVGAYAFCAARGEHCVLMAGLPTCMPTSTSCTAIAPSCDGTAISYCAPSGEVRRYDCVAHGFGPCEHDALHGVRCTPTGTPLD